VFNLFKRKKESKVENENEVLDGGLADGKSIEQIAAKHNIPVEQLKVELEKGILVEKEHTDDINKATEIASDHLVEDPKYYEKLQALEATVPTAPVAPAPVVPQPNFEEIIAKAIAETQAKATEQLSAMMQKFQEEMKQMQQTNQKQQEQYATEIKNAEQTIAELKRTAPTGVPTPQFEIGSEEMKEAEKQRSFVKNYRNGYR